MYIERKETIYGCITCGRIMDEVTVDTDGVMRCVHCNDRSICYFEDALALLNVLDKEGAIEVEE